MIQNSTLIVSVYKDLAVLGAILEAIKNQTMILDEIIISEDGDGLSIARSSCQLGG